MANQGRMGLGLWDRTVLVLAWLVSCGLVYLLGFYVGRGTHAPTRGLEDRIVRLPVTSPPPPAGQRAKVESEFTFYEALGAAERTPGREAPAAARPTPEPVAPAVSPPPVPSPPTTPVRQATPPPSAEASVPATVPAAASVPPAAAVPPAPPTPPAPTRGWTVLANPTQQRGEAETLQRQLRERGYEAQLVRVARDGETWYRVQVGRFPTAAQANETMRRLREREGVSHVFVASE